MEVILLLLSYFVLWGLAVAWSIALSRRIRKDVSYERDKKLEKIRDGGIAILAFAAGGGSVIGLFAIGLDADLGVLFYLILALGVGAVAASSVFIGEAFKKSGGVTVADVTGIKKPGWLPDNNEEKQNTLVTKSNSPAKLLQAVVYSPYQSVRENALAKMKDENSLVDVIRAVGNNYINRNDLDEIIINKAAEKIIDQSVLHKVAKLPNYTFDKVNPDKMYEIAISKITDQNILWNIVMDALSDHACKYAAAKISDPERIISLAKGYSNSDVRCDAIMRISDNAILAHIATHQFTNQIKPCILAAERLTDEKCLRDVARNASEIKVREAAQNRLKMFSAAAPEIQRQPHVTTKKDTKTGNTRNKRATTGKTPSAPIWGQGFEDKYKQNISSARSIPPRACTAGIKIKNSFGSITYNKKTDSDQLDSVICPECGQSGYSDSYTLSGDDGYEAIVDFKCKKCTFATQFYFRHDGPDGRGNA